MSDHRTGLVGASLEFARAAQAYWVDVFPIARRELNAWRERAEAIPDPVLREGALATHRSKSRHAEGAVAFALLAPRAHRRAVIRALVAYQGVYDYLDTISEGPADDAAANTRMLYRACEAAIDPEAPADDYYRLNPHSDDGGYVDAHIAACRQGLAALPAFPAVAAAVRRCTVRTAESQSLNHASNFGSDGVTKEIWEVAGVTTEGGLEWWEVAAASVTSLPVLALIGAAGDQTLSEHDAGAIEATYFPWAASLHTLLDSVIDHREDEASGHISYLDLYPSTFVAAQRLGLIASQSLGGGAALRNSAMHSLILSGMAGYYLASPEAWDGSREQISSAVLPSLGEFSRPIVAIHRIRGGGPKAALQRFRG